MDFSTTKVSLNFASIAWTDCPVLQDVFWFRMLANLNYILLEFFRSDFLKKRKDFFYKNRFSEKITIFIVTAEVTTAIEFIDLITPQRYEKEFRGNISKFIFSHHQNWANIIGSRTGRPNLVRDPWIFTGPKLWISCGKKTYSRKIIQRFTDRNRARNSWAGLELVNFQIIGHQQAGFDWRMSVRFRVNIFPGNSAQILLKYLLGNNLAKVVILMNSKQLKLLNKVDLGSFQQIHLFYISPGQHNVEFEIHDLSNPWNRSCYSNRINLRILSP